MTWPFAKYVGCGNDFIIFDNRQNAFPLTHPEEIQRLCHRQFGIGADGVLLLENSLNADYRMRILNSDGSEAEMCGNGLRCLVQWLIDQELGPTSYCIEVMHRLFQAQHIDSEIRIQMSDPLDMRWNIPLLYQDQLLTLHYLDTGVPHTVLFVDDINRIPLVDLGSFIRYHPLFKPKGTNFNIAQKIGPKQFKIRTYERGVEAETLACGTGATAIALAAAYQGNLLGPLTMKTRSGEDLKIDFSFKNQKFSHITMQGPAYCTFRGEVK